MQFLYGKPVADRIHADIRERVSRLAIQPKLAVILVGSNPASHLYVSLKEKEAAMDGIAFEKHLLIEGTSEDEILSIIARLNENVSIHGILVQLPLPSGLDTDRIIGAMDPNKDVDGFHAHNVAAFLAGEKTKIPVFPEALMELLLSSGQSLEGQSAIMVVNSEHFGRVLLKAGANHGLVGRMIPSDRLLTETGMILDARVVMSACGMPNLITENSILPNTILIDGGIAKDESGRTVGDVDAESMAHQVGFLAPVPGGVGPVTIACLLRKVVFLAEKREPPR